MRNSYYEGNLIEDISKVHKIKSFEKREIALTIGASLLGMASYGVMKVYGYDDLMSNTPLMAYYALLYLEGTKTYRDYLRSRDRLRMLSEDIANEYESDKLYNAMLTAPAVRTELTSKSDDSITYKTYDDLEIEGVTDISLVRQTSITHIQDRGVTDSFSSLQSYNAEETKVLTKTL